jgi:hypothetical protein
MSDLEHRIKTVLEPILELPDPRQRISAYHDMPYAASLRPKRNRCAGR